MFHSVNKYKNIPVFPQLEESAEDSRHPDMPGNVSIAHRAAFRGSEGDLTS